MLCQSSDGNKQVCIDLRNSQLKCSSCTKKLYDQQTEWNNMSTTEGQKQYSLLMFMS